MPIVEALLLALALCVDSLVVSATTAFRSRMGWGRGAMMALVFGLCQGLAPLLGALAGGAARAIVEAVDHWVAFGLLAAVGGKMVADGLRKEESEVSARPPTFGVMWLLGLATSIDALAVGIGLGLQHPMSTVLWVVAVIGAVTTVVAMLGVLLGRRRIPVPVRTASIIAGCVLIALGAKILLEHLLLS